MAATDKQDKSPKMVTFWGQLSFPTFEAQAAYERSLKGKYPAKTVAEAAPDFQVLVEEEQLDKVRDHVIDVFFPYAVEQERNGEKRDALTAAEVKDLTKQIKSADFSGVYNTPFKPVHEKTAPLAPAAVGTIKVIGNKGVDIEQKAIVRDASELIAEDSEILTFPNVQPIGLTVHTLYPGAYVAVTANLYAYHNGKLPGFSAGASAVVFKADGERFGGGTAVDEDEIFAD